MKKSWIASLGITCTGLLAQEIPYGQEFQVNSNTWYNQEYPSIAAFSNGGFVICWLNQLQEGSSYDILCQLFNNSGIKQGSEFQVSNYSPNYQDNPSVATLSSGGFVICWEKNLDIVGQIIDASGTKVGGEFIVNTKTQGIQNHPKITPLPEGNFVVFWTTYDYSYNNSYVYGQQFNASGVKIGEEFPENTYSKLGLSNPTVALLRNGGFIVCWTSDWDVYGQIYNTSWVKQGPEFFISAFTQGLQDSPVISILQNDDFIVCWTYDGPDGSNRNIFGQRFNATGNKLGGEFLVNTYTQYDQSYHKIAAMPDGEFVVCWQSWGHDGWGNGIFAKRYPEAPQDFLQNRFELLAPLNDASIKTINPVLTWSQPRDQVLCYQWVLHYKIFIDDNPIFYSPQIIEQDQDTTLTLQNLIPGTTYFWKVLANNTAGDNLWSLNSNAFFVSHDATDDVTETKPTQPNKFILHQNYPNPFNPETTIRFDLPEAGRVEISVYDISGKLVKVLLNESRNTGSYSVKWDGKDSVGNAMPSGIFICRMEVKTSNGKIFVKGVKMGLVR